MRFDATAALSHDTSTEAARIAFLSSAVHFFATRASIILRATNLHAADSNAARELLKLTRALHKCVQAATQTVNSKEIDVVSSPLESVSPSSVSALRATANELTTRGARLYDLLANDQSAARARDAAMRFHDSLSSTTLDARAELEHVRRSVRDAIGDAKVSV